ncbi:MAG: ribosomal-processing cysteine protease Prp [Suipraeoptans sp.]
MINIRIFRNKNKDIVGFETIGHADYAKPGDDIVCSAVSILMINTINAIDKFTSDKVTLEDNQELGIIKFGIKGQPSNDARLLLNTMILGLDDMDNNNEYSKYIELNFEEV